MDRGKQQLTQEEKDASLRHAIELLTGLVRKKFKGNFSLPLYDGGVGEAKIEGFIDLARAKELYNVGV